MYVRKLSLEDDHNDSVFLWGALQVNDLQAIIKAFNAIV